MLTCSNFYAKRSLDDYKDMFAGGDIKYTPQINEYEINPHLLFSPAFQERHAFEREKGIIPKCTYYPKIFLFSFTEGPWHSVLLQSFVFSFLISDTDYGILTPVTGRLEKRSGSPKMLSTLDELSKENDMSPHEILLKWAWDNLDSILVTSTSKPERAKAVTELLGEGRPKLQRAIYDKLEDAAKEDGYEGKQFYLHPHMEK